MCITPEELEDEVMGGGRMPRWLRTDLCQCGVTQLSAMKRQKFAVQLPTSGRKQLKHLSKK